MSTHSRQELMMTRDINPFHLLSHPRLRIYVTRFSHFYDRIKKFLMENILRMFCALKMKIEEKLFNANQFRDENWRKKEARKFPCNASIFIEKFSFTEKFWIAASSRLHFIHILTSIAKLFFSISSSSAFQSIAIALFSKQSTSVPDQLPLAFFIGLRMWKRWKIQHPSAAI